MTTKIIDKRGGRVEVAASSVPPGDGFYYNDKIYFRADNTTADKIYEGKVFAYSPGEGLVVLFTPCCQVIPATVEIHHR